MVRLFLKTIHFHSSTPLCRPHSSPTMIHACFYSSTTHIRPHFKRRVNTRAYTDRCVRVTVRVRWVTSITDCICSPLQSSGDFPEAHPLVHVRVPAGLEEVHERSWPVLANRRSNTVLHLPRKKTKKKTSCVFVTFVNVSEKHATGLARSGKVRYVCSAIAPTSIIEL